ncbi:hypothetical protein CGZ93_06360 [Enemella dayhoffiae]|uniref:Uncharacterized protein n=1 Tax=Enemella dayhoffiae TaxID=2016507 RepID=A0A255H6H7_9ACTN|nr:hypothetical protein [Enemella dayhoffiae]OYO23082.1 hypothetical protein CGZ93_06360 [Enemella dayhoffiae]
MGLARRTLLAGALALGVAGCTRKSPPPAPEPPPPPPVRLQTTRIPIALYGELSSYSLAEDLLLLNGTGSYRSQVSAIDLAEGREVWRGDVHRLQGEPSAAGTGTKAVQHADVGTDSDGAVVVFWSRRTQRFDEPAPVPLPGEASALKGMRKGVLWEARGRATDRSGRPLKGPVEVVHQITERYPGIDSRVHHFE